MAEIRNIGRESFDAVYDIMEKSFPDDEYRPYEEQRELLLRPEYNIYVVDDSTEGDIKAFITVWEFEDFAFVDHFAVNPAYRNGGIGSAVLEAMRGMIKKQICLEVELPECDMARRRIDFYTRNGFVLNEYPYMLPPISAGKKDVPLLIMTSDAGVDRERFEHIRDVLYREVYKCINTNMKR